MVNFDKIFYDDTKNGMKIPTGDYLAGGAYQIIDQSQNQVGGYTNNKDGLYENVPAFIFGDHTRVVKFVDKPFFIGADGVKILKAIDEKNDAKYLYYYLSSKKIENTGYNRHFKWLKETKYVLPPLPTQQRIAAELDAVCGVLAKQKQQYKLLGELVKSKFNEMFGCGQYELKPIGEFVKKDIVKIKKSFNETDEIQYIDISSIDKSQQSIVGVTKYKAKDAPSRAQYVLQQNDILVSTVRPNLRNVAVVKSSDKDMVGSTGFSVLRCAEKINHEFLFNIVNGEEFANRLMKVVKGANYPAVSDADIKGMLIPIPPLHTQTQFADFVTQTEQAKLKLKAEMEQTETLYKALMQKYFKNGGENER